MKRTPAGLVIPERTALIQWFDETERNFETEQEARRHLAELTKRGLRWPPRIWIGNRRFTTHQPAGQRRPQTAADAERMRQAEAKQQRKAARRLAEAKSERVNPSTEEPAP